MIKETKSKLDFLQILRGIAALAIVIGHSTLLLGAGAGVELFFIISGFIMMYITERGTDNFFLKRIFRIVPLYYISTLLFFCLLAPIHDISYLLKSLFFANGANQPIFSVGWTLNYEMIFYLLFFLSFKINFKNRGAIAICFCLLWSFAGLIFRITPIEFMPLCFCFGIIAYYLFQKTKVTPNNKMKTSICFSGIILAILFIHSNFAETLYWDSNIGDWDLLRPIILGLPCLIIFISLMFINPQMSNIIQKSLIKLGDISYSLYLLHIFVLDYLKLFLTKFNVFADNHNYMQITMPNILFTAIVTLLSIGVSCLSYEYIEKPSSRLLNGFLLKKQQIKNSKLNNAACFFPTKNHERHGL